MGILSHSSGNHTCPTHSLAENATSAIFGNISFYRFNMILSGACAAFVTVTIIILMFMHATHLSKPNEQIKIMKIATFMPFYSIISFLSICFPTAGVYISPWVNLVEAFALGSFFLLMCEFVSESPAQRNVFFAALVIPDKKGRGGSNVGGLAWYRRRWIMIFQYPVVALLVSLATNITQAAGVYCQYSSKTYFAKLWLTLVKTISLVICVLSVFRFYLALKVHLAHHQPLAKLLAFKLVVAFGFIETILFWILTDANLLNPTSKLTYADLNVGIPNLIICIFIVPLSLFFCYAYSYQPYLRSRLVSNEQGTGTDWNKSYKGGFLGLKAWFLILDPREILTAILFAFKMATEKPGMGEAISNDSAQYHLFGVPDRN